ncbi:hypothetical protein FNZ18_23300, partial [Salmonella enterica subsp. salamae]|nr:hypothetical protein [Salmonella enterica subsp. salamae]
GVPVSTLQPGVLEALVDDGEDGDAGDGEDNGDGGDDGTGNGRGDDSGGSGGDDAGDDEDEPEKYTLQFHFTDDDGIPYSETRYIAYFEDGTETRGETDKEGYTERFMTDSKQQIKVKLLFANNNYNTSEEHYGR